MSAAGDVGILSLIPAAVTIIVATVWRRVSVAIACGVVAAAAVAGGLHPFRVASSLVSNVVDAVSDVERLKIVVFVLLVAGMLEVIAVSGAYNAFTEAIGKHVRTPRRARLSAWCLSACLFFDDYANVLIAGGSMRKVTRRHGVSPAVLAYTVDVVAILASVMLVSTWAAFEGVTMSDAAATIGMHRGMGDLFLESLPFHFYTYLAVCLSFAVAVTGKWFGSRLDTRKFHADERGAIPPGNGARPCHVVAPIATLIAGAIVGLVGSGLWIVMRQNEPVTIIGIFAAAPAIDVLIAATLVALGVAIYLFKKEEVLPHRTVRPAFARGVRDMLEIAAIILLATALSNASTDLGAGTYLAGIFSRVVTPALEPAAIFVLAMLVTVATGFSWGSMAIVMPVAYSLAASSGAAHILPILSAAVVTGAVSGEHLIPYSEKAVLSAASCGIPAVYHFKTQLPQSICAFTAAVVGFVLIGYGAPLWICYLVSCGLVLLTHFAFAKPSEAGQPIAHPDVYTSAAR